MPTAQAEQNVTLAVLVNIASTPLGAASIDCELLQVDPIVDCALENCVDGAATAFAFYLRDSREEPREHQVRHVSRYMPRIDRVVRLDAVT